MAEANSRAIHESKHHSSELVCLSFFALTPLLYYAVGITFITQQLKMHWYESQLKFKPTHQIPLILT